MKFHDKYFLNIYSEFTSLSLNVLNKLINYEKNIYKQFVKDKINLENFRLEKNYLSEQKFHKTNISNVHFYFG